MSVVNELFRETTDLAKRLGKNNRIKITPPMRCRKKNKPSHVLAVSRYGPEDRPLPLSQLTPDETTANLQAQPLAFCPACNCDRPMRWKPRERRDKDVKSWFVCAICGCDRLEIRNMPGNSTRHLMSRK
jgi:hypothetical protein